MELTHLSDIARMAHIKRWHAVNVHREQNNAEHTFLVINYAYRLLLKVYPEHTPEEALTLFLDANFHDVPEAITGGDVPGPLKKFLRAEYEDGQSPLDKMERVVCPEHDHYRAKVEDTPLYAFSKLADILEARHYIMVEGKHPDKDRIFRERGRDYDTLVEKSRAKWPELNWDAAYEVQEELLYGQAPELKDILKSAEEASA